MERSKLELLIHIGGTVDKSLSEAIQRADTNLGKASRVTGVIGKSLTKGLTIPLGSMVGAGIKASMSFQKEMYRVKAISGATGNSFKKLEQQAMHLGTTSIFSSKEVASGMEDLAAAGFSTKQIIKAMPGAINMAAAAGTDLSTAVDIASSAIRGFGLSASDTGHVADVLALNANKTNAAIEDTGEALKYVSPIAKVTGMSLESVTAAIGIMANAGIKGTQAGTTLRGALVRIIRPTKMVRDALDDLGVSLYDKSGKMLPLYQIIGKLKEATKNMTPQERNEKLAKIFGTNSLSGMMALMNAGPNQLKKLTKSYEDSDGSAHKAMQTMLNNLAGDWKKFKAAAQNAGINIGNALTPGIRKGLREITKLLRAFNEMPKGTQAAIAKMMVTLATIGPAFSIFSVVTGKIDKFRKSINALSELDSFKTLTGKLKDLRNAFIGVSEVEGADGVKTVTRTLNAPLPDIQNEGKVKSLMRKAFGRNSMFQAADQAAALASANAIEEGKTVGRFKMFGIKSSAAFTAGLKSNRVTKAFNLMFVAPIKKAFELVKKFVGKGGIFGKMFSFVGAHPAVLALVAIGAALAVIYKYHKQLGKIASSVWHKFAKAVGLPKSQVKSLDKTFKSLGKALKELRHALGLDSKEFKSFAKGVRIVGNIVKQVFVVAIKTWFRVAVSVVASAVQSMVITIRTIVKVITRVVKIIKAIAHGQWKSAWNNFKGIFVDIWKAMGSQLRTIVNGMIDVINLFIRGINSIHLPNKKWVPKSLRGAGLNVPTIPHVASGGMIATAGVAQVSERGGEILDLPRGTRVYPHDLSERYLKRIASQRSSNNININYNPSINIAGDASESDLRKALKISERDFEKMVNRYKRRMQSVRFVTSGGVV